MLSAQFSNNFVMAGSSPNAGKLVGNNARSDTRPANQNSAVSLSQRYCLGNLRRDVRVICVFGKLIIGEQYRMFRQRLEIFQNR
jgi:hypothetical protein